MKQKFPLLQKKDIAYLDNAATTQKPKRVIAAETNVYEEGYANPHRGIYPLAAKATKILEDARETVADYLNADKEEIIFQRNATEGLNTIARNVNIDGDILVTEYEHHSNYLPWKEKAKRENQDFQTVPYDDIDAIGEYVDEQTGIVAFTWMSNVTGKIIDISETVKKIRRENEDVIIVVDCAQGMPHIPTDVANWDVDFLSFSGHKIYGPTGAGVLYGKKDRLKQLEPSLYGGGMVHDSLNDEWKDTPHKFEAGTINVPQIHGLKEAVRFLDENLEQIREDEEALKTYLLKRLRDRDIQIYGHEKDGYGPVVSFKVDDIHPHDLADILGRHNVGIRAGHHCAQPLMKSLGTVATARASIGCYNDEDDVDRLIEAIEDARGILNG